MSPIRIRLVGLLVALLTTLSPRVGWAHEFRPGVLSIEPTAEASLYRLQWSGHGRIPSLRMEGGCELEGELPQARLRCPGELRGMIVIGDFDPRVPELLVRWPADGGPAAQVVTDTSPYVSLGSDSAAVASGGFFALGLRHISTGLDHLAFVWLLWMSSLLGPGARASSPRQRGGRLIGLLTAFTLAHSLSLAAMVLDWVVLRTPMVESWIAASLAIAAAEIVRAWRSGRDACVGWTVVFVFGLVHGLGFAGALSELLRPGGARWRSLLAFNLGIEAGQLIFVSLLFAGWWVVRGLRARADDVAWDTWPRLLPLYAIGTVAIAWTIERTYAVLG